MKYFLLLLIPLMLTACHQTNQQKAEKLVKFYLIDSVLNNPISYESVKFNTLKDIDGLWTMSHTFRYRNSYGGIITKTLDFYFDPHFNRTYIPPNFRGVKL